MSRQPSDDMLSERRTKPLLARRTQPSRPEVWNRPSICRTGREILASLQQTKLWWRVANECARESTALQVTPESQRTPWPPPACMDPVLAAGGMCARRPLFFFNVKVDVLCRQQPSSVSIHPLSIFGLFSCSRITCSFIRNKRFLAKPIWTVLHRIRILCMGVDPTILMNTVPTMPGQPWFGQHILDSCSP